MKLQQSLPIKITIRLFTNNKSVQCLLAVIQSQVAKHPAIFFEVGGGGVGAIFESGCSWWGRGGG